MSDSVPSVSVVIPCFNASAFVTRTIHSAIGQSLRPIQIICVDDGSTDDTVEVIEKLRLESNRRIDLIQCPHQGAGAARNVGLAQSSSDYIQFLDADDILLPKKIEKQLQLIASRPADTVAGSYLRMRMARPESFYGPRYLSRWANLITGALGATSANLWRREAVLNAGGWNEKQESSQEYDLLFRMMKQSASIVLSHEPLTHKIDKLESITSVTGKPSRQRHRNILNFISLRRAMAEYLEDQGLLNGNLRTVYYETVHARLKDLYPYNPQTAVEIHREVIPDDYRLQTGDGPGVPALEDLNCAKHCVTIYPAPKG
jgi:glycosyltransferase involved in cell wall biosynthesis